MDRHAAVLKNCKQILNCHVLYQGSPS